MEFENGFPPDDIYADEYVDYHPAESEQDYEQSLGNNGEPLPPDYECCDYYRERAEYYGDYSHLDVPF